MDAYDFDMTRYLITNPGAAARTAKNVPTGPGLPNQSDDNSGRTPMVDTTTPVTRHVLSARARESLCTPDERYPFAYGYLASAVRGFLDGHGGKARLRAVLAALNAELQAAERATGDRAAVDAVAPDGAAEEWRAVRYRRMAGGVA